MMKLGIKNKLLFHPAKLNNILDINLNKINVEHILDDDDLIIYNIKYNDNYFHLVIDNVKGYFEKTDNEKYNYLTIILIMKNMKKYLKAYGIK